MGSQEISVELFLDFSRQNVAWFFKIYVELRFFLQIFTLANSILELAPCKFWGWLKVSKICMTVFDWNFSLTPHLLEPSSYKIQFRSYKKMMPIFGEISIIRIQEKCEKKSTTSGNMKKYFLQVFEDIVIIYLRRF